MENELKTIAFERLVVRPIENGFLLEIESENDDEIYAYKNLKQVMRKLREIDKTILIK